MATSKRIARWAVAGPIALALAMVSGAGSARAAAGSGAITKHTFNGRYITAYHGFDSSITGTASEPNPPAVPYSVSGALFSDGNGNVTGFENIDYGSPGTGAASQCTLAGTYSVATLGGLKGMVTLNLTPTCKDVTCSVVDGKPVCTASGTPGGSPTQWFCALSGPSGKGMVCTEMGEAASGTTFQTPISAVAWERAD